MEKILRKDYNLMKKFDLIPEKLNDISKQQTKSWFKKVVDNLIGGTTLKRFFDPE